MMGLLAGLALLDLGVLGAGVTGIAPVWVAAALHALLMLATLRLALAGPAPIAMIAAAALGPIAVFPAWIANRLRPAPKPRALVRDRRGPTPGQAADRRLTDRIADDRLHSPEADRMLHFTDLLRHGDVALRQRVVTTVVRNFDPRLSPLIVMALTDADQSLRTQAAAAVAEIEQALSRARTALEGQPGRRAAWDLTGLLAEHVLHNRLLSEPNRRGMCAAAIAVLDRLTATLRPDDPEHPAIARRQSRLLLVAGRPDDAVARLDGHVDPADPAARGLDELVTALIAAHRYDRLAELADAVARRAEPLDPALADRLAYWRRAQPA